MTEPQVRLHDVSIEGDAGDRDALLAAIERAVAQATVEGTAPAKAVGAAVKSVASDTGRDRSSVGPSPVPTRGGD